MRIRAGARVMCRSLKIAPDLPMSGYRGQTLRSRRAGAEAKVHFSPEQSFVIECCRSAFAGVETRPALRLGALDFARVVRLARFHGVQGLVWRAVGAEGSYALGELRDDATAIAASNLKVAAECGGILADFEQAGIKLIFLKGLALCALAYDSASLKSAVDADLLIAPDKID